MKLITGQLRKIFVDLSTASIKSIILCVGAGFVSVIWPLGGVLLFIISRFSDEDLFGRFALLCTTIVMCSTAFGLLIK